MQFLFAIVFLQATILYLEGADPDAPEINQHGQNIPESLAQDFDSVPKALLSLFASVTGGIDWILIYYQLHATGYLYGLLYLGYLWFMLMGVLNVVVGVFVEGVLASSSKERAMIATEEMQNQGSYFADFKAKLTVDNVAERGRISEARLMESLSQPEVKRCFEAHKIDSAEARSMLRLFGHKGPDEQFTIDIDDFIVALLLLKGERGRELVPYWFETKQLSNTLNHFIAYVQDRLNDQEAILNRLSPP